MSLAIIGVMLFMLILFFTGLLVIIRSKIINNWIFIRSARLLKGFGDIPNPEAQREASLWVIRIFSFLVMCVCVLFIYFVVANIDW
jgi:hypothetical protein